MAQREYERKYVIISKIIYLPERRNYRIFNWGVFLKRSLLSSYVRFGRSIYCCRIKF